MPRTAAVLFLAWVGCAHTDTPADDGDVSARPSDEVVSVKLTSGGGMCTDCCDCKTVMRGVSAPDQLVLEDAKVQGQRMEERFTLSAEDYESVIDLASSKEFAAALSDPSDCPTVFDSTFVIEVEWKQRGVMSDTAAAGCVRGRSTDAHVYTQLYWKLIDLQQKFLACPKYPPGQESPLRPLCNGCFAWTENPC